VSIFFQRSRASILLAVDLAFLGHLLVGEVALFELFAEGLVEVGGFVGAEEGPGAAGFHALHEQVGNPVRRVHVVRAAAVVAGVSAELEEFEDVVVPGLEVGAAGALALAALIDGDELVVVELEERDDALRTRRWCRRCRLPVPRTAVQEPPRPPAHLER